MKSAGSTVDKAHLLDINPHIESRIQLGVKRWSRKLRLRKIKTQTYKEETKELKWDLLPPSEA